MGKIVQFDEVNANQPKPLVIPTSARRRVAAMGSAVAAPSYDQRLDLLSDPISNVQPEGAEQPHAAESETPVGGWSKRLFDIVMSFTGIVVLAPLLLLIAIAVRLDSPGPSVFKQDRGGFRGRAFRIYKFRTLSVSENRGVVQVRHGDARITRLGSFLRRSSWDELPQLFNVLKGDMSLIGPRPHAVEHDQQFEAIDARYPIRRHARPGVTGLAQVNGSRGPTETVEKVRIRTAFDAEYVMSWSWLMDIKILVASAVVLSRSNPDAI